MIEVVVRGPSIFYCSRLRSRQPFFHLIAMSIASDLEAPGEILATTLVSYALSSILTGLAFFLLGYLKLGAVIGFFPRHILVGCVLSLSIIISTHLA